MSEDPQRRAKIEAFYKKYAPSEMAKVENAMKAKIPEAELFKMLRDKYKVTDTSGVAFGDLSGAGSPMASPQGSSANFGASPSSSAFGTGGDAGKRARIEAFYKKYAPTEMAKVENAMKAKIAEGELFKMLRDKYNITDTTGPAVGEPEAAASSSAFPPPAGANASSTSGDNLRDRVTAFFQKHAPQDIGKVDKTLSFGLEEEELFSRLRKKYNVSEDGDAGSPPGSPLVGGANKQLSSSTSGSADPAKDRILAFLEKHAPQDVKKIDKIMAFNLPEDEMIARLCQKYGVTDDGGGKSSSVASSAANTNNNSEAAAGGTTTTRDRVKAFLEKHAPQDVGRLDKLLAKGLSEDDLMTALRNKYGVADDSGRGASPTNKPRTNSIPPSEASSSSAGGDSYRDRVKTFLEKHAPQDVGRLDKLIAKGLPEEDLMKALRNKYGITEEATTSAGAGGESLKDKVTAFFQKYAPNDMNRVDKAVALGGQVGEEELFNKLRQKYNASPGPASLGSSINPDTNNNSNSNSNDSDLRGAVTAFFRKHAPNDMHRVDKAVALGGQVGEAELFNKLRQKYNVSEDDSNNNNNTKSPTSPTTAPLPPPAQNNNNNTERKIAAAAPEPEKEKVSTTAPPSPVQSKQKLVEETNDDGSDEGPAVRQNTSEPASYPIASAAAAPTEVKKAETASPAAVQQKAAPKQQQQQVAAPAPTPSSVKVPQFSTPASVSTFVSKFMESQNHKIEELLFSLQQREDTIANREKAIEAREIAFESRCLSIGAEPTRVVFDAAGHQTAEFVSHMVDVESTLAAATADLIRFEKALREQEQELADRQTHTEKKERLAIRDDEERKERQAIREKEIQKQNQSLLEMQANQDAERKRLAEIARQNADKESDLAGREARVAAQLDSLRQREAALEIQQDATMKEREASRKFSEELLQREGTVRAVERSLNAARSELTRLENDVSLHAKKLLEDQRALRRWSEELERREERFQRKNPNAKN